MVVVLSELSGHRKQKKRNDFAIDCFMIEGGSGGREREREKASTLFSNSNVFLTTKREGLLARLC